MGEDDGADRDLQTEIDELTATVERLQSELQRSRKRRRPLLPPPPSATELRRFTSEVAIPGLILLLETNVRALKLLRRTLRLADDGEQTGSHDVQGRAADLGTEALARLEDALAQAQDALEGQAPDGEARELLAEARDLRADIESQLQERAEQSADPDSDDRTTAPGPEVDVEAELRSIKDQVGDDTDDTDDTDGE
jgi:hypothetical protein